MPIQYRTAYCLGRRDMFSSWWSLALLVGTWSLLIWYLNRYYFLRSQLESTDLMSEILKMTTMMALFGLATLTAMITMPGCGGIQLDRLRNFIRESANSKHMWAEYVFLLLPRLSDTPCCATNGIDGRQTVVH
jgi:hypothetical protein